ncbi:hypothetical protein BH23CHL6_BH23CHL6_00010 [soil metagenome]
MSIAHRLVLAGLVAALLFIAAAPAEAAWGGRYSVYSRGSFSGQVTNYTCVGASIQMMLNMIRGERDKSAARQMRYWRYARNHSRYLSSNKGADPRGWALALRHFGAGYYRMGKAPTLQASLRVAAKRMRVTGKPVGMLVAHGGHAWVMTGFEASADPKRTDNYRVTGVQAMGPLWPSGTLSGRRYDPGPKSWLGLRELRRKFNDFRWKKAPEWDGRWMTVIP